MVASLCLLVWGQVLMDVCEGILLRPYQYHDTSLLDFGLFVICVCCTYLPESEWQRRSLQSTYLSEILLMIQLIFKFLVVAHSLLDYSVTLVLNETAT